MVHSVGMKEAAEPADGTSSLTLPNKIHTNTWQHIVRPRQTKYNYSFTKHQQITLTSPEPQKQNDQTNKVLSL